MFFDFIHKHRLSITLVVILAVAGASLGIGQLRVSTDNRIFYGPQNPYYLDYLRFEESFTSNDTILFVVSAPFSITYGEYPSAIRWLTEKASALNHVIRIDSLANYPHPVDDGDTLYVQSFLDWACPESGTCRPEVAAELQKSHLVNRLVSENRSATGVLATVAIERGATGQIEALHADVKSLSARFRQEFPQFEIYYTGGVPMMAAFAEATANDLGLLLPCALAVISGLLILVLGSFRLTLAILLVGILSVVTTLGTAGWVGHVLNNATSIVPLIVFTLVVTGSMHIAVHFSRNVESARMRGEVAEQAKASLESSLVPIVLSALTSAVSLCSLWFVDSPPIRELGLISGLGMLFGCVFTLVLLPLLLIRVGKTSPSSLANLIQAALNKYSKRLESGKDYAYPAALVLIVVTAGLIGMEANENFVDFFDESMPFRVNTDKATEILAGPNHIEVLVRNKSGTVFEPPFLDYVQSLANRLRQESLVANAHSFADVMEEISQAFADKPISEASGPDELAQLFLIYELSLQSGQSNTDLVNGAQDTTRISVLLKESTSSQIQAMEQAIYTWHGNGPDDYELIVTGENIPVAHLSWMNIRAMVSGIFVSLAFSSAVLGLVFRSARLGAVALLATVAPVLAGFGLWGWINDDIGLAATGVIALTIGVVVDDAAHYIYRLLDAKTRIDSHPWSASAYAIHRAGTAIVSSSIVMGIGLSVLLLSSFEVNSTFGAVAALIIATALAFDLLILPRLAAWAIRQEPQLVESTV